MQFALLGIYSGQLYVDEGPVQVGDLKVTAKARYDLGVVWYAQEIREATLEGVSLAQTTQ